MDLFKKINAKDLLLILVGGLVGGLLGANAIISSEAIFGLIGVMVGALIPSVFQSWAAGLDRKNQLRVAAIDKRLEVHQEAYALWSQLHFKAHNPEQIHEYVIKCQKWWNENCLYLTPKARSAFKTAYTCANNHKNFTDESKFIRENSPQDKKRLNESIELIMQNWSFVTAAAEAIIEGVELPTIGEKEFENIE